VIVGVAVLAAAAGTGAKAAGTRHHAPPAAHAPVPSSAKATKVVAFAKSKVGRVPYVWGGTTDAGMDCSGLAMDAWASAGVTIERTSQQQWASERHVASAAAGDLVFFAGSDGTPASPGHVGIVTGKNQMIDAFGTGTYVRAEGFGPAATPGTGLGAVVGYTDPGGNS
jgi:cell wall-associated NlpC family hydrolase